MKRAFDIAVALVALVLLSPVMLVVAILVAIFLGRPVLFRQTRPGLHAKSFKVLKFRTMTDAHGPDGELLPDADRLPAFGRVLRSTSLDELPQFLNILRGDISLVGPRPLLVKYLPHYTPEEARRHDVRPGITGWAQVNGRNAVSWDEKLAMDVWYVDHRSFWLDLRILWRTVWIVLARSGTVGAGSSTMTDLTEERHLTEL
jgi:lipopolysaccharide/colanic/teichoic acid biosynthesis glycosyltransferase